MSQYQQPQQTVEHSAQQTGHVPQQTAGAGGQQTVGGMQGGTGQQQMGPQGLEFPTSSYLPEQVRREIVQILNRTLADTTVLLTHAHFAHWNVKGMAFYGLHDLFEEIYEMFEEHADLVAERITALGGQAMGTAGIAVQNCRIPRMPTDVVTGQEFLQVLAERLAVHDANLKEAITAATEWEDLDTADLLNEISREVSQALWFIEAHLQTQPISTGAGGQRMAQQPTPVQQ